jgi:DNA mismatch repair protein MSH6
MTKGNTAATAQPPATPTPGLKKSTSSSQNMKNQKTLLGFFQKTPNTASSTSTLPERLPTVRRNDTVIKDKGSSRTKSSQVTPAQSSDALDEDDGASEERGVKESSRSNEGLPSPVSSANGELVRQTGSDAAELTALGTPSRKVSYQDSPNSRTA